MFFIMVLNSHNLSSYSAHLFCGLADIIDVLKCIVLEKYTDIDIMKLMKIMVNCFFEIVDQHKF